MSKKHPVIAVTGSSGAGTTTVKRAFEHIFFREKINAAVIEGDSFHSLSRIEFKEAVKKAEAEGNMSFSHFGPAANRFDKLAELFETYGKTGGGKKRYYIHSDEEAAEHNKRLNTSLNPGEFTPWEDVPAGSDVLFYEGYVNYITPQFSRTDINFQRVSTVDTSNPFISRDIPTPDESFIVIRFREPKGTDFPYLLNMIPNSFMSRRNTIVVPGAKMGFAMELILAPIIQEMIENKSK